MYYHSYRLLLDAPLFMSPTAGLTAAPPNGVPKGSGDAAETVGVAWKGEVPACRIQIGEIKVKT